MFTEEELREAGRAVGFVLGFAGIVSLVLIIIGVCAVILDNG